MKIEIDYELSQMIDILEANGYKVVPTIVEDEFSDKINVNVVYKDGKPVEGFGIYTGNSQINKYVHKIIKGKIFSLCTNKVLGV